MLIEDFVQFCKSIKWDVEKTTGTTYSLTEELVIGYDFELSFGAIGMSFKEIRDSNLGTTVFSLNASTDFKLNYSQLNTKTTYQIVTALLNAGNVLFVHSNTGGTNDFEVLTNDGKYSFIFDTNDDLVAITTPIIQNTNPTINQSWSPPVQQCFHFDYDGGSDDYTPRISESGQKVNKCTCGAHAVNSNFHSSWCDIEGEIKNEKSRLF